MTIFAKTGLIHVHSFKSHLFSTLFDGYNNRLMVHVYTIPKRLMVSFYWGLILEPVWHPRVLRRFLNGSTLPGQADNQHRITTRLAGETGNWCSYILWHVDLKTASIYAIWLHKFLGQNPCHFVVTHWPHPPTYWGACNTENTTIYYGGHSASYLLRSRSTK